MKKNQRNLIECCAQDGMVADDGEPVLRNLKILGLNSANRRRYTLEAATAAVSMYSGAKCNLNHPANASAVRDIRDRFGVFENITVSGDGVRGDLRYNPKHPMSESILWWAKHQPEAIGLSHNAVGQGHDEDGIFVVERILDVRSIDLVSDPATNLSMFEHNQGGDRPVKMKIGKLIEHVEKKLAAKAKRLIEMGMLDDELEVDAAPGDDGEVDHEAALTSGFESACTAIVKKVLDGSMDAKEGIAKLKEFLNSHGKLSGGGNAPADDGDDSGDDTMPTEEAIKKHPFVVALANRLDAVEVANKVAAKKAQAAKIIDEAKLPKEAVTALFVESVESANDEKAMKAIVEERRKLLSIQKPRSTGQVQNTTEAVSYEQFVKTLKKGA